MRYLLALILLASIPALGADIPATAKLTWSTPATNVNGIAVAPESITKYRITWGTDPAKLDQTINVVAPTNAYNWSANLPAGPDGSATAYFAVAAYNGTYGPASKPVGKRFVPDGSGPPAAPDNVIVITAGCTAPPGWTCKVEPAP